eukprot:scaffold787_cov285-Chaetoceros_neogracile.AAC.56
MEDAASKRKISTPPAGYLCSICKKPGHWIQQCSHKKNRKKRKGNPTHIHVPGVDPSQENIDRARDLQKIKPPKCFCGEVSRLKKVKRVNDGGEDSRAIGHFFFFCNKAKHDESKCRFARPVEDETMSKKDRICTFFAKTGSCKKGDKCMFSHDVQVKKSKDSPSSEATEPTAEEPIGEEPTKPEEESAEPIIATVQADTHDINRIGSGTSSSSSSSDSDSSISDDSDSD